MKNNALYITAASAMSGKSAIALGMMRIFSRSMRRLAIFRPIIRDPQPGERDAEISLLLEHFKLDMKYEDTFACTQSEAREIINRGSRNLLLEKIIRKYRQLIDSYDFTLCMGTDFPGRDTVFEFELNAEIAANLGCPVLLAASGFEASAAEIGDSLKLVRQSLETWAVDVIAMIISRSSLNQTELDGLRNALRRDERDALVYAIPNDLTLGRPTLRDVKNGMDAEVLAGADLLETQIDDYLVGAMHLDNFINYLKPDQLVITPGDRADILLGAIASTLSGTSPRIAGVLLTGGLRPQESIRKLIDGVSAASPLPVLFSKKHTYRAITLLQQISGVIEPGDDRRISAALNLFEQHVNGQEIVNRLLAERKTPRITPLMFEFELIGMAKKEMQRIVLAEGEDERILRAADILLRREVARIILLGDCDEIRSKARALDLDIEKATLIDPCHSPDFEKYASAYCEYRKAKGITPEQARETMKDATYFGTMMVRQGDADGMVSGAVNTTAHTIRPAFEFIKTKPGFSVVSSVFLMCLKDRVLVFGDCAVNPNPTAQQLAEIAIASAHTAEVFGIAPRVAMLSYSTGTSGKGPDVDKVVEAVKIAKELRPDLMLEGPLQYDAAIDPVVANTKLPGSQVAGRATVFIFPDLNTGNNTYKAVQRAANAIAIGPVLQGLNKPVNDLSRGCLVPDIVNTVAITAVQAAADKKTAKAGNAK